MVWGMDLLECARRRLLVEVVGRRVMDMAERPQVVAWLLNWRVILPSVDEARCIFGMKCGREAELFERFRGRGSSQKR